MKIRSNLLSRSVLVAIGVAGVSGAAFANPPGHAYGRYEERRYDGEYARVTHVEPLVTRVRVAAPQRECWEESREVYPRSRTETRSTLIGGLIGAAVGHRIGEHAHVPMPAAIIGGTLIGAAIGNDIGVNRADRRGEYRPVETSVQRCAVNYRDQWEERVDGYRVTYVYHGRAYTTRLPYDPGRRLRVNIDVSPDLDDDDYDR